MVSPLPRRITSGTKAGSETSARAPSRSGERTSPTASGGSSASARAGRSTSSTSAVTVRSAAPPVRRTAPFRLFSSWPATSTATFGRASKLAPTTPIGIRRSDTSRPFGSVQAAISRLERRQLPPARAAAPRSPPGAPSRGGAGRARLRRARPRRPRDRPRSPRARTRALPDEPLRRQRERRGDSAVGEQRHRCPRGGRLALDRLQDRHGGQSETARARASSITCSASARLPKPRVSVFVALEGLVDAGRSARSRRAGTPAARR